MIKFLFNYCCYSSSSDEHPPTTKMTSKEKTQGTAVAATSIVASAASVTQNSTAQTSLSSTNASSNSIKHLPLSKNKIAEQNNKKQHLSMQHQKSAKPRATPTKIVERRPVPLASNKNLNNVKKQPPPNRNSTLPQSDQVERNKRIMLSDTSRLV